LFGTPTWRLLNGGRDRWRGETARTSWGRPDVEVGYPSSSRQRRTDPAFKDDVLAVLGAHR